MTAAVSAELLQRARADAAQHERSVLESLRELSGWDAPTLTQALGDAFGYAQMSMAELHTVSRVSMR